MNLWFRPLDLERESQTYYEARREAWITVHGEDTPFDGESFRHTPVVVAVGRPASAENILIAAHSYDADDRPLSTYEYKDIRFLKIYGVWKP